MERHKGLTIINILGLSIGIACFSLFLLYVINEFSFDRIHLNASRIYRVYDWWAYKDRQGSAPASATPIGPAMKQDIPDVENFVRYLTDGEKFVRVGDRIQRFKVSFSDPQIFSVFTFPLLAGDPKTALAGPNQIVLTRELALKLFGVTDVVGRVVEIKTNKEFEPFVVGAVAENIPVNSTIRFEILGNIDYILNLDYGRASINNWNMTIGISVYILLNKGSNLNNQPDRLASFRQKYFQSDLVEQNISKSSGPSGYGLQPLLDVHSDTTIDKEGAIDPKRSWILIFIASGILLIACINFTTLSIGRSSGRAKEVGIKKAIGSRRNQLITQFLTESLVLSLLSSFLGLALADFLLPAFNEISGKSLVLSLSHYPEFILVFAGVILLTGILSGLYPAIVLSRLKPIDILKNNIRFSGSNMFTKSLVTFQFVLSIGFIISMIVIMKQLAFIKSKNLGFEKENIVMINLQDVNAKKQYPIFRQSLLSESGIIGISASAIGLGEGEGQMGRRYNFNEKQATVIEYPVDSEFLNVLGMKIIAGRNFDREIGSDTVSSVIVNEALVQKVLGVTPAEAPGMEFRNGNDRKIIIGVTRDFNFEKLTKTVRPQLFLQPGRLNPTAIFVRIKRGDPAKALAKMASAWENISPDLPFQYSFLDEKFESFYREEKRWSNITAWAGGLSIFLTCMGLFGLLSLAVINRSKEIGIRKINGSNISEVMFTLNKDTIKLAFIAFIITTPISWYLMVKWLQNYAYRTDLNWWIFILAWIITLLVALLTISWQSWLAAKRNPVEMLRYE